MTTMAALSKSGRDVVPTVIQALDSLMVEDSHFILASPSELNEADSAQTLREANLCSSIAVGCILPKRLQRFAPQFARNGNAMFVFEGRLYSSRRKDFQSELYHKTSLRHEKTLETLLKEAEGDFLAIAAEPNRILAVRDSVGVQPFYYAENADLAALATNRTALWKLGMVEVYSLTPGNLASVGSKGFEFKPVKTLVYKKPRETTLPEAAQTLQQLLEFSVRVRVRGMREVAVAFSGGLDSSVVAFLAKKCGTHVHLVHVSLFGQRETEDAKGAADDLKLPLSVHLFEADDVEKTVSKVVELIEEPDPVKAAIGIPFYWIAQKTAEAGLHVLLAGQGADELFGGYQRYVNEYLAHGEDEVRKTMFNDVAKLHESNIERDEKICGFHGVELRLPFASFGIAEFASSLPVALKIEKKPDGLRKLVLRRLALNAGLPEVLLNKPKKAIQYATGVNEALRKIARKHGVTVRAYVERLFREGKC
jgi:asparagine synthase (glutamine-hydrolysing)